MNITEFTLAGLIRHHGAARANAPALTFEGSTLTFGELDARSTRVADALAASGVQRGDRVAVLTKNRPEFFELAFGCAKAGAILVGLNWRLAPREIAAIVADATPRVVFASKAERPLLGETTFAETDADVVEFDGPFEAWRDGSPRAMDPLSSGSSSSGPSSSGPSSSGTVGTADDVVMLLYTSGTTGVPKGVMITNRGLSYSLRLAAETWGMMPSSVNLIAMPLFHVGGIGYGLSTMSLGGHSVLMREVDPAAIIAAIAAHRVTHAFFVPAVIQMLLLTAGVEDADLTSLELLCYGASPIGDAVLKKAIEVLGCGFTQAYGMTETSGTIVSLPPSDHEPEGERTYLLRSCGKAVPWVDLRIIDPNTLDDVKRGDVGEIWVRSEMVTPGYWNKPEESAEAIVGGEWLRTGDAAYQDDDGYLYLFDRFKDMIVSGAENIYPAEVENVLYDHPAIQEVAVIGVPDAKWGETPKAIAVLRAQQHATAQELIEFCRGRLAKYKCPTSVEFIDVLPRNASGKVLKKDLRQVYWHGHDRAIN